MEMGKGITCRSLKLILQVKMVVLQFRAEHEAGCTSEVIKADEKEMIERIEKWGMECNLFCDL